MLALMVITIAILAAAGGTGRTAPAVFGPTDAFYSVVKLPSGKWLVVGASGVLLSSDDGKSWTRTQLAKTYPFSWLDLFSIRFAPDGVNGWISGEQGLILHTTDAGKTWQKQRSGVTDNLYRVAPVDAQNAVASGVGGSLLYTHDGGQSWQLAKQKNGFAYFDAAATDAANAWAVGEFETILHSSDGGKTWTVQRGGKRINFRQPAYFTIRFRDSMHGWVTGQGATLLMTSDGGKTWQPVVSPTTSSMFGTVFTDARFWMAGDDGVLLNASLDGSGKAVTVQPTFSVLNDVAFAGQTGIAVGFNGTILSTDDGGGHWQKVSQ
jgi:photosystem II stability/assembly factor-like uncharacterized protein